MAAKPRPNATRSSPITKKLALITGRMRDSATRKKRVIRAAVLGAAIAGGVGWGAGKIAHAHQLSKHSSRVAVEYSKRAARAGNESLSMVENLPWSVLYNTRIGAKRSKINLSSAEFDRLVDQEFTQRKKRDAGDRDPSRVGFASNPTIEAIDALMKLDRVEIERRLQQLYPRNTPDSEASYQYDLRLALNAKPELARYFAERAGRAVDEARQANSASEKKALEQIARASRIYSTKIGILSGGAALLAYLLLAQAISRKNNYR